MFALTEFNMFNHVHGCICLFFDECCPVFKLRLIKALKEVCARATRSAVTSEERVRI